MTAEAIRGEEYITFEQKSADRQPSHCAMLPFTRNVFDPMDFRPSCSTSCRTGKSPHDARLRTRARGALRLRHPALRGNSRRPREAARLREGVSQARALGWDDTRFLAGEPGKYVVLARRATGASTLPASTRRRRSRRSRSISPPWHEGWGNAHHRRQGRAVRAAGGEARRGWQAHAHDEAARWICDDGAVDAAAFGERRLPACHFRHPAGSIGRVKELNDTWAGCPSWQAGSLRYPKLACERAPADCAAADCARRTARRRAPASRGRPRGSFPRSRACRICSRAAFGVVAGGAGLLRDALALLEVVAQFFENGGKDGGFVHGCGRLNRRRLCTIPRPWLNSRPALNAPAWRAGIWDRPRR